MIKIFQARVIMCYRLMFFSAVWCCGGGPPAAPPPRVIEEVTRPPPESVDYDNVEDNWSGVGPDHPDWEGVGWGRPPGFEDLDSPYNMWGKKWGSGGKNRIPPGPGEPGYVPGPGEPGYRPGPGEPGYRPRPGEPGYPQDPKDYVPGYGEPGYIPPKYGEPGYRPGPGDPGYRPLPGEPGYQSTAWMNNPNLPENWQNMGQGFYGAAPPPWAFMPKNVGKPSFCLLPPLKGPCKQTLTRYGYNPSVDGCRPFPFSGCGGNKNNFKTLEACIEMCGRLPGPDCDAQDSQEDSIEDLMMTS